MRTQALWAVAVLVAAPQAVMAEEWFVVGVNHCSEVSAGEPTRALRDALARQVGTHHVLSEDASAELLGGTASEGLDQVEALFSSARVDMLGGNFDRAKRLLSSARLLVRRLPPSPERWDTYRDLNFYAAWNESRLDNVAEADADYYTVFSVDPDERVSPKTFPPRPIELSEKVRRHVAEARKVELTVRTEPPGLPVFVGLRPIGNSPAKIRVPPGEYVVEARFPAARGLPQHVLVDGSTEVNLSSRVEGAVWPDRGPCISAASDRTSHLGTLVRIGSAARVSNIVAVELDEPSPGDRGLTVSVVDASVGREVRAARIKLGASTNLGQASAQLASFVVTGQAPGSLQVLPQSAVVIAPAAQPGAAEANRAPVEAAATQLSPEERFRSLVEKGKGDWKNGNLEQAVAEWREGANLNSTNPEVRTLLCKAALWVEEGEECLADCDEVLRLVPDTNEGREARIMRTRFGRLVRPKVASLLRDHATKLMNEHRYEEALTKASRSNELDPSEPWTHEKLGEILAALGRTDEAAREYQKAIDLHIPSSVAKGLQQRLDEYRASQRQGRAVSGAR